LDTNQNPDGSLLIALPHTIPQNVVIVVCFFGSVGNVNRKSNQHHYNLSSVRVVPPDYKSSLG